MVRAVFHPRSAYAPSAGYRLLPLRFGRLDEHAYIVTNDVGEYVRLARDELVAFLERRLDPNTSVYKALKSRHFLYENDSSVAFDLLALKYRSRAERVAAFTGLHIFVVTLRCDHSCQYCQVSRQSEDSTAFDMTVEHADKALDLVFRSPNEHIKIEFQGGEPLLNFPLVRHIVERARKQNEDHRRDLQFVITSNLSRLSDDVLSFCKEHGVYLSTSLDGPADLHDGQRPTRGGGSHRKTVEGIHRVREALGPDRISALMTTTPRSLSRVEKIIDEYVHLGFHGIFLRSLSPYGFAARSLVKRYGVEDWLDFYKRGLSHILRINAGGYFLREEFTTILLQKMFSPLSSGYVDLQSPAGIGIGALVYNYDGAVYASDEGRMLAEMGDQTFRLGHLDEHSYEDLLTSEALLVPLGETILEGMPMCADCPFLPYCGADPVFHRATQGDAVGHKAFSAFCTKQMGVLRHVIGLLETDAEARDILLRWV
ncbi:His-Xaa-Ser system radical SAM maturase HxsB [Polyangium mundeleinium]|uniref:His-Xaa-Ser system radical SAM maturase HxsB n=1 Tax=Polyangium mundeleinium TaxID=2995306 RepID=A0ABT5EG55_9BACT|nr:His-Xaa-Ser system radical SAM maturase HxsB [Polyangium mundeleinium]MDC0740809.1 His-Xaa-Ser system radical SAM maturase HxsB [Polyangium mundeleinium]